MRNLVQIVQVSVFCARKIENTALWHPTVAVPPPPSPPSFLLRTEMAAVPTASERLHAAVAALHVPAVIAEVDAAIADRNVAVLNMRNMAGKAPLHVVFDKYKNTMRGRTLLPAACIILEHLLAKGANPNLLDAAERTPLLLALRVHAPPSVIEALLRAGADPNAACCGRTPFVEAVESKQYAAAAYLLEAGADPMSEDTIRPCIGERRFTDVLLVDTILKYTPRTSPAYVAYTTQGNAYYATQAADSADTADIQRMFTKARA